MFLFFLFTSLYSHQQVNDVKVLLSFIQLFAFFVGVLDCKFHPKEPWLFTAGGDSVIKLYCNEAPSMY